MGKKSEHVKNTSSVIKAGDTVKVKGTKDLIKVNRVVNGIGGNSVVLATPVRGFFYFNESELIKVK